MVYYPTMNANNRGFENSATGGIRRKFREALDDRLYLYPRKKLNHPVAWYLGYPGPTARPLYGVYSMATFAEYLMHQVRFGRRGQEHSVEDATRFFAETRRALQNVLSTYPIGKRMRKGDDASVRAVVTRLVDSANVAYQAVVKSGSKVSCPTCQMAGRIPRRDAELLESILLEQSANGTIPKTSCLYRKPGLTP